jgi:hypothetical protein
MESVFAVTVLLFVPCFLGVKHIFVYYDSPFSMKNFGVGSIVALFLFVLYLVLFFHLGIDGLYELSEERRYRDKFFILFVLPSFGFGIAIFNLIAFEYLRGYESHASTKLQKEISALVGWLLIAILIFVIAF